MRAFIALILCLLPMAALAQEDSIFQNYDDFTNYVDDHMMNRDFIPMVQRLGGRDEYTQEQLSQVNTQLLAAFPQDFPNKAIVRSVDMGAGFREEAWVYWQGLSYAWFYVLLHDRGNDLLVIQFNINSNASVVLDKF